MKLIDLKEAKTNLEQYARECQASPVVVTVDRKPAFEILPIRTADADFVDRLIEEDEAIRELLEDRHREYDDRKVTPLDEIRRRLT